MSVCSEFIERNRLVKKRGLVEQKWICRKNVFVGKSVFIRKSVLTGGCTGRYPSDKRLFTRRYTQSIKDVWGLGFSLEFTKKSALEKTKFMQH